MSFGFDTFTDAAGTNLTAHIPEVGGPWFKNPFRGGDLVIDAVNRARAGSGGYASCAYNLTAIPATAEYDLLADFVVLSNPTDTRVALSAHYDASVGQAFVGGWDGFTPGWFIGNDTASSGVLASTPASVTVGNTYQVHLEVRQSGADTTLSLYIDGVLTVGPITRTDFPAAGKAGFLILVGTASDAYGIHVAQFTANNVGGAPATSYTAAFDGPAVGAPGVPSSNILITPNGDATGIVITPSILSGGTGTFTPSTVTGSGSDPLTLTFTPDAVGAFVLSFANDGGLTDPPDVDYSCVDLSIIVCVGDSQTENGVFSGDIHAAVDPHQYDVRLAALTGYRIDQFIPILDPGQYWKAEAPLVLFIIMGGANDFNQGASAATALARAAACAADLVALGSNVRVIWETLPAGDIIGGPTPLNHGDYNILRNAFNAGLYSSYDTMNVALLSDVSGTVLGPDDAYELYTVDSLHLTVGAQAIRAQAGIGAILSCARNLGGGGSGPTPDEIAFGVWVSYPDRTLTG